MKRRTFLLSAPVLLGSLVALSGCQTASSQWPSHDSQKLAKAISFPSQPQQVRWQPISLPESNDRSVPGPTDMVGIVAILSFDEQTLEALIRDAGSLASNQSDIRIFRQFAFDWYPQVLRDHLAKPTDDGKMAVTLQGYNAHSFFNSSTKYPYGSFIARVPGTADLFLYYQNWFHQ